MLILRRSLSFLWLGASLVAQVPVPESKQPLQELMETETVYPQEKYEIQFTMSNRFAKASRGVTVTTEYGITNAWQVGLEWNASEWRDAEPGGLPAHHGIGDLEFGTKYSFLNIRGSRYHAAVAFSVSVPTGSVAQELGEGLLEFEPTVILARDLPRGAQIFTQVGISIPRIITPTGEPAYRQAVWNFGAFVPYRGIHLTLEATTQSDMQRGMNLQLTPGVVVKAPAGLEIGMGFMHPVGAQERQAHFVFKITREFGRGE